MCYLQVRPLFSKLIFKLFFALISSFISCWSRAFFLYYVFKMLKILLCLNIESIFVNILCMFEKYIIFYVGCKLLHIYLDICFITFFFFLFVQFLRVCEIFICGLKLPISPLNYISFVLVC